MRFARKLRLNRYFAVAAFSLLLLGFFLYLAQAVARAGSEGPFALDLALLERVKAARTFPLTRFFLELTALGSASVLITLCLGVLLLLGSAGRWLHFTQLSFVGLGGWGLMELLKRIIGRARPSPADQLDFVTGFSFPSGHSSSGSGIYFTLAFFCLPLLASDQRRALWLAWVALFVSAIACSRVYLGVHYPSDALAGVCLGTGLACLSHLLLHKPWRQDH